MPAEMLGSIPMRQLMISWREAYDYVVIDTPPVLAVTDAVRLSSHADSVLLILRSGQTTRQALARSCDVLNQSGVPVLGIVVNSVDFQSSGSYYYGCYRELAKRYYDSGSQNVKQ
jgi:Mrp family chromosome partitioning ATPase